ncbi:hypothetical protein Pcinc_031097, partial [Petrolisthes cinctipes]
AEAHPALVIRGGGRTPKQGLRVPAAQVLLSPLQLGYLPQGPYWGGQISFSVTRPADVLCLSPGGSPQVLIKFPKTVNTNRGPREGSAGYLTGEINSIVF